MTNKRRELPMEEVDT